MPHVFFGSVLMVKPCSQLYLITIIINNQIRKSIFHLLYFIGWTAYPRVPAIWQTTPEGRRVCCGSRARIPLCSVIVGPGTCCVRPSRLQTQSNRIRYVIRQLIEMEKIFFYFRQKRWKKNRWRFGLGRFRI